ncbi:MAG: hypothetical protein EPN93_08075 [Spirochaetes bacterium]|nr:MAG: hypothetical protein EPN93_08075 [Spirochaetota bacterium]
MHKMRTRYIRYLVPFIAFILLSPAPEFSDSVRFGPRGLDLYNVRMTRDDRGREVYRLDDNSYREKNVPSVTDLVLSFNGPASSSVRDDTGNYTLRSSVYDSATGNGVLGGGGASFYKKEHRVEIESARNQWMGSCEDLGSFTIEMRIYPVALREDAVLLSRMGQTSGARIGIELVMKNGHIVARLSRLFKEEDGRRTGDFVLNRGRLLEEKRWYHVSLSFDRITGKLALFINGEEDEMVYASERGEPGVKVYKPCFSCEDLPIAIVGKNFYGIIDELRISYRHFDDLKRESDMAIRAHGEAGRIGRVPVNREGVVTSPVLEFPHTGTGVLRFQWGETLPAHTFIWFEFRTGDDLFTMNADAPRWYRIENGQRNIYMEKSGNGYLRGRYYQWRAHLAPSPDGNRSPELFDISLNYLDDDPPLPPRAVEAVRTSDNGIRLRWRKSVEEDILGYRVYYGTRSRAYDGVIGTIGGARISNDTSADPAYIEIEITNKVIDENMKRDGRKILEYPLLKNGVLYFFAVTAYDTYRPDSGYNHESRHSEEISARPFAGSEITR